jgi:uncharacterized protein (TIGR00369 family)
MIERGRNCRPNEWTLPQTKAFPLSLVLSTSGRLGRAPFVRPSMLVLFDINIETAEPGVIVLTATPTAEHYNPMGFVHGGYAAVLLDTCMGATILTSLEPGLSAVTLEYKINFARPMSADTGVVRGEGKTLHVGRQMAIAEGRLLDATGRLLAHGTTTCHVAREGVFPDGSSRAPTLR